MEDALTAAGDRVRLIAAQVGVPDHEGGVHLDLRLDAPVALDMVHQLLELHRERQMVILVARERSMRAKPGSAAHAELRIFTTAPHWSDLLDHSTITHLLQTYRKGARRSRDGANAHTESGHNVTAREREILGLLAHGLSSKQMARELGVSPNTVKTARRRLYTKLGVTNSAGAVARAISGGFLPPQTSDPGEGVH